MYIDWQIGFLDYQIVEISEFPCLGILTGKLDLWIIRKYQCWTVGAIFTFARSQMFGPDKLGSLAVGRSRSCRMKNVKHIIKVLFSTHSNYIGEFRACLNFEG